MDWQMSAPVQCSEDPETIPPPSLLPPQSLGAAQAVAYADDVQPDAERVDPPGAAAERLGTPENPHGAAPAQPAPRPVDRIELLSRSGGRIEAENLAGALQPGGIFNLGNENVTHVHHGDRRGKATRNKYPLTASTAEPVIRHLDIISAGLAGESHALGTKLGLADATLKQISLDFQAEGQHEVNYRILALWKQRAPPGGVSLKRLARALVDVGRGDLADELRKG